MDYAMSDDSLISVLQLQTSNIIHDRAKISIKSEETNLFR